jgi:hypothetical protein
MAAMKPAAAMPVSWRYSAAPPATTPMPMAIISSQAGVHDQNRRRPWRTRSA